MHAAAVNPTDILARDGSRAEQQKADPPPYVPGMDAAGIVDEVGDGVSTGVTPGDAVIAMVVPKGNAVRTAWVSVSPVRDATSRASRSVSLSFKLNAMARSDF